ncbi:alpha/beta hydrolase family protein [Hymenobacter sediminicola]|uniref:Alpha/beta hydrolase n=1 Tax=Hymenobacter sediminicola TaxID=2761579 RepID=A0A7G7W650_9BACT|nr:alpha/beta hydrolase [Hymenobacter sediminicola]QNH61843.1 alpha/beta hydrolase [Hymenobacter sediminicola]
MKKSLYALFLFCAFLFTTQVFAADGPVLNGQWRGPLKVPGGQLELIITIIPLTNGGYYAALDVPQQRIYRMPVEVTVKGNELSLEIEQAGSSFVGKIQNNGALLSGNWKQPGLSGPLQLQRAKSSEMAAGKVRLTPPYREDEISFTNPTARLRLSGMLTVPAGPGPFPAVVLVSDSGPQDRDAGEQEYRMFSILGDYLTRRGIAVLRFDDRGTGKSQGIYLTATTQDLVGDAQAAMAFLRGRELINPQEIGFIGHGEGANVALLAAADAGPAKPAFVISMAGYGLPGRHVLTRQQLEIMRLIGASPAQVKASMELHADMIDIIRQTPNDAQARGKVAATLRMSNTDLDPHMARARAVQLTSPWSRYFIDFEPMRKLPDVKCPVLAINGADDLQVEATNNLAMLRKGLRSNRDVTTRRLTGVNHWLQPKMEEWAIVNGEQQPTFSPKALDVMREWIAKRTTQPNALPVTVKRAAPAKPAKAPRKPRAAAQQQASR